MPAVLVTLIAAALAFWLEGVPYVRERQYKEALLYTLLLALGSWWSICAINIVPLPRVTTWLYDLSSPVLRAFGLN